MRIGRGGEGMEAGEWTKREYEAERALALMLFLVVNARRLVRGQGEDSAMRSSWAMARTENWDGGGRDIGRGRGQVCGRCGWVF